MLFSASATVTLAGEVADPDTARNHVEAALHVTTSRDASVAGTDADDIPAEVNTHTTLARASMEVTPTAVIEMTALSIGVTTRGATATRVTADMTDRTALPVCTTSTPFTDTRTA